MPFLTDELLFNQPMTGCGKPSASQDKFTVTTLVSRYAYLDWGWLLITGFHRTENRQNIETTKIKNIRRLKGYVEINSNSEKYFKVIFS